MLVRILYNRFFSFFFLNLKFKEKFRYSARRGEEKEEEEEEEKKSTFLLPAVSDPAYILSSRGSSRVHSLYAPLLLVCARESPRRWQKKERERESGRRGRDVEAESYLVKNRLRAAHLVPFARTTSGLMHSARWKRASVCARPLLVVVVVVVVFFVVFVAGDGTRGERSISPNVGARRVVVVVDSHSSVPILIGRRRYTEKGPEKRERETGRGHGRTGVVVKSVKSP